MKKILALMLAALSMALFSCNARQPATNDNLTGENQSEQDIERQFKGALTLETVNEKNVNSLTGFGVEWDPHFFRSYNTRNVTSEDWELVKERAKELGIQKIRVMYLPGWIEPYNDNDDPNVVDLSKFDFESEAFKSLLAELDVAEELGIDVNITIWGADLAMTPWLAYPDCGQWLSAPNNPEEFAENASVLFDFLLNKKGYKCVKELTIHNEPDWAFINNAGKVEFDYYVTVCRATHERFIKDGLRGRVKFILSDDTFNEKWLVDSLTRLSGIADGYNSHCYVFGYESTFDQMYDWAKKNNGHKERLDPGKPYTHNEFGSNKLVDAYHQQDIDTYERGLLYAMQAVSFLNAGSAGMLHWEFFDQYYYDGPREEALMSLGLFEYKDRDWRVRPIYHAWGLIMKHTKIGMDIYRMKSDDASVQGVKLSTSDGKTTYIVVNANHGKSKKIKLADEGFDGAKLDVYIYSKNTVSESDKLISSIGKAPQAGGYTYLELEPDSFAVVTNLN